MISKSNPLTSSATLSTTAPLDSKKSADVPSVTFSRTSFTKSSSMPMSAKAPLMPPHQGADRHPEDGDEEDQPEEQPPEGAVQDPKPARLLSWRVLGLLFPWGQETIAASTIWISSCFCRSSSL